MARYNHDDNMLLGTTAAGTLRLALDDTGLDYTVDLPAHRSDVYELIARGDVRQSSFAFRTFADDWGLTEQGYPLRTLLSGQLVDVAPVNTPAYPDTSTGLRSLAERYDADPAEVERLAREGELRRLIGGPPPVVVDLGGTQVRAAIPVHHTATVDEPWDGPAAVAAAPNDRAVLRYMHAWVNSDGDPDVKASYKFPHHAPRTGSAANLAAVRNALARLPQADIPAADRAAVERHLRAHLDDAHRAHTDETSVGGGQGDAHPPLSVRRRYVELMARRFSPLEQGGPHSAPVNHSRRSRG